jgi:cytochrome c-type biogenesis protein CcmH/NrfG
MTDTTGQGMSIHVRRAALLIAALSLAAMIAYSMTYRVQHPSLTEQNRTPSRQAGMGDDPMAMVGALMQKLQENPGDVHIMSTLGRSFMSMQSFERALTFWDMILDVEPENTMALNQKGVCLFRLERFAEAVVPLEKILTLDKGNLHAHFNLGILYKHYLDDPARGASHFRAVLDGDPDDPALLEAVRKELGR